MTSNSRSSSKCKDDGSNGLKKKVVNGTGSAATGSGAGDSYSLRKSVRDSSSNKEVPATSQSTRRSERFVKSASVSPVSNRKSGRISKELTPSPLRRSDRGKKQISSGSLGQKKSEEKVSVAVDLDQMKTKREKSLSELTGENKCEGKKSGRGKKQGYDGRAFRALFKRQSNVKAAADKNGISSSERDSVVEETSAIAEKLVVDLSTEEQGQTPEVAGSSLTRKSQNDGIDVERGDDTTLSKRKIDLVVDLDASATDGRREDCTSSSDNLHSSSGCKTHSVFRRCATCSKRQRFCDGIECKMSCDVSCSNHSTHDAPAGVWHCFQCLNNKMQAGACSLPGSVEAIWNAREAEVSNAEGLQKEKQYFVKYRGLAHIHNQWIAESRLLLEAGESVEEFNRKREVVKWNEEWVVPHRLLKKRLLLAPGQENGAAAEISSSKCEWLVKWRGLDYINATWELDTSLGSAVGQNLIKEYENRHKKALGDPSADKDNHGYVVELQKLPAGSPPGLGPSHLDTLNKLREFRHKGQNAVVFDDQDRIMKTILYIVSLSNVCQPFLIVTTSFWLPVWESEFLRVAPSIDVVVYDGSSDNRKSIRTLEFYDDGGGIMLQVLLSSVEIIVEDLHFLESMKWKVVIVDECQQSLISSQFEQIKMLVADVKLLLYGGPLKDDVTEYVNLLSLLDSCGIDVSNAESSDTSKFKERLSQYIASECKSNSPRKSCDHPYIVDPSLKVLITKDLPPINFLDVEIRASGKLQLLEMILSQIRRQQLRVLLLFQSVAGSGRDTLGLGDILDDFLRERFGENTYERLDGGAVSSKLRQKALNSFNKGSGRFVFLLENRACLPSIRLVSVDTIIIFDSDWNPANDIKALNRISIDSQSKQMKIFRLYSAFTVEEKVLILAKQGLSLESNLENISRATSNTLLMWGVSSLFNRLDEFHSTPDANVSSEQTLARKVVDEILALLSQHGECDGIDNYSISKIQQRGGVYSSNLRLLGEQQVISSDCEHPHIFWENLLKGRNPKWKFLTGQTHRHRKKVQYFDDSPKQAECEAVEVGKKRKKGGANFSPGLEQNKAIGDKIAGASGIPEDHGLCCMERQDASVTDLLNSSNATTIASEKSRVPDAQNNFNLSVKTSMLKLCEILKLSDDIKNLAERFLEYVVSNHQVSRDENILQAFLISLCWCSASLLNQKVDRVGSLLLAQKHLKFICNEKEADSVYSAVRKLKKAFKENVISDISKGNILGVGKSCKGTLNEKILQLQNVKLEHEGTRDQVCTGEKVQEDKTHNVDKEIKLKLIQKKFRKQIAKLKQKQDEEIKEFNRSWQAQREDIEKKQKVESAIIGAMYTHEALRMDKLKASDNECAKKLEELERQKEISFKQLKARHLDALSDENRKLSQGAKSATPFVTEVAGQKELPLPQSGVQNEGEYSRVGEYGSPTVSENVPTLSRLPNLIACEKNIVEKVPGNTCGMISNQASKDDEVENMALVNVPVATSKQPIIIDGSVNIHENTGSFCRNQSKNKNPEQNVLNDPGRIILSEPLKRIPEKVIGDANSLELKTPAVEYHAENDTVDGTSSETPNVLENHTHGGEANSSADVKSSSTEILKLPEKQPALSTACNQVEVSALQVFGAEKVSHVEQLQSEISTVPVLGHTSSDLPPASGSAPRLTNERDTFPQNRSENTMELSGQDFSLDGQIAEENDQARHLANEHHEIPPRLVEHPTELPDQVLPLLGANVDLHTTTDVIETPLPQNQPDLPSSTLDHQPVHLSTYLLNSEAVPQVNESTTELPRQAVVSTRVNMSVQGQRAEHQVPSRIPKVTSYSDPLQNQLEGIRKETEQAIKLHEEGKMRLKFEFEESVAQLRRNYEAKCKEAEDAFLWKKKELDTNHNKVLVNKILADAFRSKCVEPSRYTGSQHAVHPGRGQHLNQLPQHTAPRPSPITVASSAGQPASSQQNTALRSQPASRLHLNTVSSMARQPSANQQNTTLSSQYGTRILPVTASSDSQPAATQLHTTLLTQPEPGNNFVPVSSSAGQPATYQQNNEPLSQPSARISPISLASSGAHSASGQQSTQPPLQIVHQSAALFSSISTRPPQINPITLSMGNVRVGNENRARAPAPHLQAFRSASSVNTSAQRMAPGHLTPTSLPASSSYPLPCSVAPNMAPNYSSAIYSKSSTQSNAAKDMLPPGVSAPPSASMSNQELLKTHGAQRPDEPLPDLGSTLDSIDFSVFETGPSLPPSSEVPDVSTNLVCLSDED
nr:PREDICTED: helicase protein MOM1-like isoform X2 [Daucus carota subsp. sativus]